MEVSPGTKLNKQFTFSYNSFAGSSQVADGSSDFTCDLNKNHDLSRLPKDIPLKQLASGSPHVLDRSLKETDKEHHPSEDTLGRVHALSISFAIAVTVALILRIYLWESLVFIKGVVVSDHEGCTALGQRVLCDRGSSVDAAISAALCLGVVHPHVSGVGGGGVMLVHDIHKNETRVINFQGAAPQTLKEEMLQNVSELKAGLQVGVPGQLRGFHCAHSLYGSLSWADVVAEAAAVAREGFNVSFSLAEAISKVKGEQLSQRFQDTFLPGGQPLLPGSFLRMSSLAGVLEAGLSNFYEGNVSQEIEDEVRANGGVLSRDDLRNYRVQVEQPEEGLYSEFIIQVPPLSSAGATLISVLNLLEGLHLNESNITENRTEALKGALAVAGGLGDAKYNSSVTELLSDMLSSPPEDSTVLSPQTELMAGQVAVMGPDGLIVTVASSLSTPFGSRIMTRSGVLLNSLMLDFSRPIKTQRLAEQKNSIQPGERALSSLMPTVVVPAKHKCGLYMALSSSGGQQSLRQITQVLMSELSLHKETNNSVSLRGLHPQHRPSRLLVDPESPEDDEQLLHGKGHVVQGILRNKDIIMAIRVPSLS